MQTLYILGVGVWQVISLSKFFPANLIALGGNIQYWLVVYCDEVLIANSKQAVLRILPYTLTRKHTHIPTSTQYTNRES